MTDAPGLGDAADSLDFSRSHPEAMRRITGVTPLRSTTLALLVSAAVPIGVAIALPTDVFWSLDEGAKLLQLESWMATEDGVRPVLYPGAQRDPERRFYPSPRHYPRLRDDGSVATNWSDTFGVLSWLPYRWAGLAGLYVIPLLAGLATVFLTGLLAARIHPRASPLAMIATGLCTPILYYSLVFWEHTLVTALGVGALLAVSSPGASIRPTRLALGGVLLGVSIWLRTEMVLFAVAVFFAWLWEHRGAGRSRGLWVGVGLSGAVVVVGLFLTLGAKESEFLAGSLRRLANGRFWGKVPEVWVATWFSTARSWGPALSIGLGAGGIGGVILCAFSGRFPERARRALFVLGGFLVAVPSAVVLCSSESYRIVHGLFLVAPALILAFLDPVRGGLPADPWLRFLNRIWILTLALGTGFLVFGIQGGLEWGPRYLLILFPVAMAAGIGALCRMPTGAGRRGLLGLAAVMLIIGFGYEIRGLRMLNEAKGELHDLARIVRRLECPVVTTRDWLPGSLAPLFMEKEIYVLERKRALQSWISGPGRDVPRFVFIAVRGLRNPRPDLTEERHVMAAGLRVTWFRRTDL